MCYLIGKKGGQMLSAEFLSSFFFPAVRCSLLGQNMELLINFLWELTVPNDLSKRGNMFTHANFSIDVRSLCKDFLYLSVVWFYALLEYIAVVSKLLECL